MNGLDIDHPHRTDRVSCRRTPASRMIVRVTKVDARGRIEETTHEVPSDAEVRIILRQPEQSG